MNRFKRIDGVDAQLSGQKTPYQVSVDVPSVDARPSEPKNRISFLGESRHGTDSSTTLATGKPLGWSRG
jgi:hypothetical protein